MIRFGRKDPWLMVNRLPWKRYEARQQGYNGWAMRFLVGDRIVVTVRGPLPVHFASLDGDDS